jgi:hypothetical protein
MHTELATTHGSGAPYKKNYGLCGTKCTAECSLGMLITARQITFYNVYTNSSLKFPTKFIHFASVDVTYERIGFLPLLDDAFSISNFAASDGNIDRLKRSS